MPVDGGDQGKSYSLLLLRDTTMADREEHRLEGDRDIWKATADKQAEQLMTAEDTQRRNERLV